METAGKEDIGADAEREGIGLLVTRASILGKLEFASILTCKKEKGCPHDSLPGCGISHHRAIGASAILLRAHRVRIPSKGVGTGEAVSGGLHGCDTK